MNYKEFIQKYEELLNSGYCECNELNCLDNNPPKKILNIMKEQQQEIERLNNNINELEKDLEDMYYGRGKYHMSSDVIGIKDVLDKIKTVKDGGKNEPNKQEKKTYI